MAQPGAERVPCNSLWIGDRLGPVERACLRSIMGHRHPMVLWCYGRPAGVPDGVEIRDAAEVLPQEAIIRHRSGSVALFANRFRYELQRRGLGLWVDTDVYLLKPLLGLPEQVFGWGFFDEIYNGVLRLPPDSPLIPPLLDLFNEDKVPPWLPWRARLAAHWRLIVTGRSGLPNMPWGSAGPMAMTALARRHGLDRLALRAKFSTRPIGAMPPGSSIRRSLWRTW